MLAGTAVLAFAAGSGNTGRAAVECGASWRSGLYGPRHGTVRDGDGSELSL
jgi:hypothetical protein